MVSRSYPLPFRTNPGYITGFSNSDTAALCERPRSATKLTKDRDAALWPGSLIFITFNFMLSIKADVSHAAYRMGILEMTRQAVTWFITAYIFLASPSAKESPVVAAH